MCWRHIMGFGCKITKYFDNWQIYQSKFVVAICFLGNSALFLNTLISDNKGALHSIIQLNFCVKKPINPGLFHYFAFNLQNILNEIQIYGEDFVTLSMH